MAKMENYYDYEEVATVLCRLSSENVTVDVEIIKDLAGLDRVVKARL